METHNINVLLIDNNPKEVAFIREALEGTADFAPFNLESVEQLSAGLERASKGEIDVVLLGSVTLDEKGPDSLKKADMEASAVPFVVLAETDAEALAAMREGAQDYLVKGQLNGATLAHSLRNVVEKTQAQEALRSSEERLRKLFEISGDAIFISGPDGKVIEINESGMELCGFTPEQAFDWDVGQSFVDSEERERFRRALLEGSGTVKDFEVKLRRVDGVVIDCLITASRRHAKDGSLNGVQGFVRDITRQKKAEEELRDSEARFRAVVQSAKDAIVSADTRGNIVFWNEAAEGIFGYKESEAIGNSLTILIPERYREAHKKGLEHYETTGESTIIGQSVQIEGLKKNGDEFPLELSLASWTTVRGSFVSAIIRDITERKLAEETLKENAIILRQSERMAQLSTLTAGIAHELNNPAAAVKRGAEQLQTTIGHFGRSNSKLSKLDLDDALETMLIDLAELAEERSAQPIVIDALKRSDLEVKLGGWLQERGLDDVQTVAPALVALGYEIDGLEKLADCFSDDRLSVVLSWLAETYSAHSLLTEIGQGAGRMSVIVNALKSYSYLDQAPVQAVDVNEGLEDTLLILRGKLESGINVERAYAPDLPKIQAYGGELNQVWTNLIDNAADALEGHGDITIRTSASEDMVIVDIEDNGPGIPEEYQQKIFDPFFTTKPPGEGTGLGLNISYGIVVQKHHGDIKLSSRPGKTQFKVSIPLNFETFVPQKPVAGWAFSGKELRR